MLWQRYAARLAERLCQEEEFDVVHHVSWGTVGAPPLLYRLARPVVWGPLGGGQTMPSAFREYFRPGLMNEYVRKLRMAMVPLTPRVRRMASRAALTLATNEETRRVLERAGARRLVMMLDNGLPPGFCDDATAHRAPAPGGELRLLWAGRCEPRKALPLGLDALARTKADFSLTVAGDGPCRAQWEERSRQLGLTDRVKFLGVVPWKRVQELFRSSDVFLFTSLRDSFGSVVLEAMGQGLPILTLDHNGVRSFVSDEAGIRVSVNQPQQTIDELASAVEQLASDPARRQTMGHAALSFARTQTWDLRVEALVGHYRQVVREPHGTVLKVPRGAPA
jgi:glycosyltransferase involved in cell wall biosynthesis